MLSFLHPRRKRSDPLRNVCGQRYQQGGVLEKLKP